MSTDHLWRKSSYSGHEGECVEVAPLAHTTGVRDTQCREHGRLDIPHEAWRDFVRVVRADG